MRYSEHKEKWLGCKRCKLWKRRNCMVFARGKLPCQVLFIGEAPGDSEDILGKPFVGPAGKLLDRLIKESQEYSSHYTHAITNLICCIPKGSNGDTKEKIEPPEESVEACKPRLIEFITKLAKPSMIVAVGKYAEKYAPNLRDKIPMVKIIHPAAILRSDKSMQGLLYQQAMLTVADEVGEM